MVRFVLCLRVLSAALYVLFKLSLGCEELFIILTISCLASSAISTGRAIIFVKPGNCSKVNTLHTGHGESLKIKNASPLWGGNYKKPSSIQANSHQENQTSYIPHIPTTLPRSQHYTNFLQFQYHMHSRAANRIYQLTSLALLQERIHLNRRELDSTSRELLNTHLRIANLHSESDGALTDKLTLIKAKRFGEKSKSRQLKKFTRLQTKDHPVNKTIKGSIINLIDKKIDDAVYLLLQKD